MPEVAKYDIIEQKVYTLRLKIEAKGLHLMEQKVYTFCTIFWPKGPHLLPKKLSKRCASQKNMKNFEY